jgi:hypothetical protein
LFQSERNVSLGHNSGYEIVFFVVIREEDVALVLLLENQLGKQHERAYALTQRVVLGTRPALYRIAPAWIVHLAPPLLISGDSLGNLDRRFGLDRSLGLRGQNVTQDGTGQIDRVRTLGLGCRGSAPVTSLAGQDRRRNAGR